MTTADADIRALVATRETELGELLAGSNISPQKFRETLFQLWADPNSKALRECRPETVIAGVMDVAAIGLTFSKQLGHAYLVPFKTTATPVIGYRGLIHLALQSGGALDFRPGVRYEHDDFYLDPLSPIKPIRHIPADGNRGKVVGYYCVVFLPGGLARGEYMSKEQVEQHRDKYSRAFQNTGKWGFGSFDDMALKTVVRKVCKFLRLTGNFGKAVELTDYVDMQTGEVIDLPDDNLPEDNAPQPVAPVVEVVKEDPLLTEDQVAQFEAERKRLKISAGAWIRALEEQMHVSEPSELHMSQTGDALRLLNSLKG